MSDYVSDLVSELRRLGVPGEIVEDLRARTASYLAESGDDPEAEFGPAPAFARVLAEREGLRLVPDAGGDASHARPVPGRVKVLSLGLFILQFVWALSLVGGASALLFGSRAPLGLNPWLLMAIGTAGLGLQGALMWSLRKRTPRSGRIVAPGSADGPDRGPAGTSRT